MNLWKSPDDPLQTIPPLPRSVWAFAAIALGMILARSAPVLPGAAWFSLGCAACAVAVLTNGRACRAALVAGAVSLGAGVFTVRIFERPINSLIDLVECGGPESVVTVEGLVLDDPRAPIPPGAPARFAQARPRGQCMLDVSKVLTDQGWRSANGMVRVRVPGSVWSAAEGLSGFSVRAGQRVRMTGLARPIEAPLNPGEPDYRLYGAQENLAGWLEVESAALVHTLSEDGSPIARLREGFYSHRELLRARARAILDPGPSVDGQARALLLSLFLGADETGQRDIRRAFTHVGLAHVLAISGFHLTVMAYVALFLVRLSGDRGMLEPCAVAALILLYLLVVPASAPVVRAGLLSLALMGAEARGRRYGALAVLGWAGVALILWRPLDLWGLGFQLSLGLTALLLWVGRYTHSRLFGPTIRGLVRRPRPLPIAAGVFALDQAKSGLSSSLLCWATATPLIAFRTGLVNPVAVVTGLVVLPSILLLMGAGYTVLIAGILVSDIGAVASGVLVRLASVNVWLVEAMDGLPGSGLRAPPLGVAWTCAATATILFWFLKGHRRHAGAWVASALVSAWLVGDLCLQRRNDARTVLRVDAPAVGDGSCILLRSGGETLLWNCGSTRVGIGERTVPQCARALGAWRVATVVISGDDLAHFAGLLDILEPLGVRRVILLEPFLAEADLHPEGPGAFVLRELRRVGVEIVENRGDLSLAFGNARLTTIAAPSFGGASARPGLAGLVTVPGVPGTSVVLAGNLGRSTQKVLSELQPESGGAVLELPPEVEAVDSQLGRGARGAFVACSAGRALELAGTPSYAAGSLYLTGLDGAYSAEFDGRGVLRAWAFRRPGDSRP